MREQPQPVISLAQGIVHWAPPASAVDAAKSALDSDDRSIHGYGPVKGSLELQEALKRKLAEENGIENVEVMVTAGANQAFANIAVSLVDESDRVVLFKPYYFNHLMAVQMTGGADKVLVGDTDADLLPDLAWLRAAFRDNSNIKMVVIVNPGNPSGCLVPKSVLQQAADLCAENGAWLVSECFACMIGCPAPSFACSFFFVCIKYLLYC